MSTVKAAIVACLLACLPGALLGFDQSPAGLQNVPIKIYATGSFLGQFDGMVVYPAHSRDTGALAGLRPYGGLLGVADWLRDQPARTPRDLLLVAGDNFAHGFARRLRGARTDDDGSFAAIDEFWHRLDGLQPTAIGMWSEDFYRALAPPSPTSDSNAGRLAKWLAGGNRKLLASNAAVRLHRKRLNQIKTDHFELEVDRDRSLAWDQSLSLSFDCELKDISFELRVMGSPDTDPFAAGSIEPKGAHDPCHGQIDLKKKTLRPGQRYDLMLRASGNTVSHLSFETDRALTPVGNGEPAIIPADPALPIVISFVDPDIRKRLPQGNWEWTPAADALDCKGQRCEIVFHEPAAAFAMLRGRLAPHGERYFALLAGVTDSDATGLLNDWDAIKFVVLPADSGMLGLGASERKEGTPQLGGAGTPLDPPYAGDWGNVGILDGAVVPAARAWVRVQWMGANAPVIEATVTRRDPEPKVSAKEKTANPAEWDLNGLKATSVAVQGYRMCAEAAAGQSMIRYRAAKHGALGEPMELAPGVIDLAVADRYPVYVSNRTYDGRNNQGTLWTSASEFAAMTLDRMRDALHAEIALFPATTVDDDYIAYLAEEQKAGRALNWLSREVVKRALFRADRAVRVKVEGSKLASVLGKILGDADGHCAAGLGDTSCKLKKVDEEHLRVNGRKIQPDHFYGIAMLAGMAAQHDFEETRISDSLIELVDDAFTKESGAAVSTCAAKPQETPASPDETPLAERLELNTVGAQPFYLFKPLTASFGMTELKEPATHRNRFSSLPLSGSKVADQVKWAIDGGANIGVDWRRYALYGTGTLKYGKTRIHPHDKDAPTKAIDPDEYRIGLRFDIRRWFTDAEGRLFTGLFQEGELSREGVFEAGSPWPEPSNTRRRRYRYVTGGAEVDNWWSAGKLSMKQIRAALSHGTSYAERQGIHINGGELVLLTKSLTTLLDEFKAASGAGVETIEFDYIERRRTRAELGALFELPLYEAHGRKAKVSIDGKYFFYRDTENPAIDLVERHHAQGALQATFPGFRVLDFGVKVENQSVWLRDGTMFSVIRTSLTVAWPLFGKRGAGIIW